jgi:hypothetical protein
VLIEEAETLSNGFIALRRGQVQLACFENLLSVKVSELYLFLSVPCRSWRFRALHSPKLASAGSPALCDQLPPRFTLGGLSNNYPALDRNPSHSCLGLELPLSYVPVSRSRTTPQTSPPTGVVPLLEPLYRKIERGREIGQEQRHEAGHTVLTPKRAHRICRHGVTSCTHLRDYCWHEKGRQKKSLRFATFLDPPPFFSC